MFGLFKKKVITPQPTKKILYRKVIKDIGVTSLLITFKNNTTMTTKVYGNYYQRVGEGFDEEPVVCELKIYSSLENAQIALSTAYETHNRVFIDDPKNPTRSVKGEPKEFLILETSSYEEEISEAYLEDIN